MRRGQLQFVGGLVILIALFTGGCARPPGTLLDRHGDEIVAGGQLFHTGTPVVLWMDAGGYDAYACHRRFSPAATMPSTPADPGNPERYSVRRHLPDNIEERVQRQGWDLADLQQVVTQFVIHYDAAGTSRQCFKVLHDLRGLSVQFMLDLDGTVYQTLDLKERAWHAGTANDCSVGVEIANIGAYRNMDVLDQWYVAEDGGWPEFVVPERLLPSGIRTPHFIARPARPEPIHGRINGHDLVQYDYTPEQYAALSRLSAALVRIFPKMRLDVPRDASGAVRPDVLSRDEQREYRGLLGHWHITTEKVDPGPAFDWERVLRGARRQAGIVL